MPSHTSHHNIISEGIGCVLTVHGTIAWEYAYFKIPAICASQNNPHINFDFAYHAKNRRDLTYAIKNFQKLKEKELVIILDVGAYGMSLSSNYNLRPKATELLIKNSKIKIISKRQKLKDLI